MAPGPDGTVRVGVTVDGGARRGFPTPSGRLEFYSTTLRDWGWPELAIPTYVVSQVARERMTGPNDFALIPTFRLPVLVHTRTGNAKWLNEIAHANPVWIHPFDAARIGIRNGDLVRVETDSGHLVNRAWVTEGIRPGVVACSHHMGRWRLDPEAGTDRWSSGHVDLRQREPGRWTMRRLEGARPFASTDPDSSRIWWRDVGVHQNLIFPPHPDPISGAHAWHQKVAVRPAGPDDREGDISVDTTISRQVYREWLALTRPGPGPGGLRRPEWLLRPLRPTAGCLPHRERAGRARRRVRRTVVSWRRRAPDRWAGRARSSRTRGCPWPPRGSSSPACWPFTEPGSGLLIAIGFFAAFMSGLVGVGGAVLLIPLLLYLPPLFGFDAIPIATVTGITIVQVTGGALSAGLAHLNDGHVDRPLFLVVGSSMAVCSFLGALLSAVVPGAVLEATFATMALVASAFMLVLQEPDPTRDPTRPRSSTGRWPSGWAPASGSWPGWSAPAARSSSSRRSSTSSGSRSG